MLDRFPFNAAIDVPLTVVTLLGFLMHLNAWARSKTADTNVDLSARLPLARVRVVCLFAVILVLCWTGNIAIWAIFLFLLVIGFAIASIAGGDFRDGAAIVLITVYAIREWAFGFPQLILHPQRSDLPIVQSSDAQHPLVGRCGKAVSPLRPCGEAELDGCVVSVISDDGLLDVGTEVVVTGIRNGIVRVRAESTSGI